MLTLTPERQEASQAVGPSAVPVLFVDAVARVSKVTAHFPNSPDMVADVGEYVPRRSLYRSHLKRAFDIVFVIGISFVVVPVVLLLSLLVMLDGHWPFFVQDRVGRDGHVFRMLKLRSMVKDADKRLAEHLARDEAARVEWLRSQKLRNDPRVTRIGGFIRRCSLDELPQFWNVLMGQMSVVGPRPMMPSQRDLYPGRAYYALRPGVTGMWQVGTRNNTLFSTRARYDSEYYQKLSFGTDLVIILKTFRVMVLGTGV